MFTFSFNVSLAIDFIATILEGSYLGYASLTIPNLPLPINLSNLYNLYIFSFDNTISLLVLDFPYLNQILNIIFL